MNINIINGRAGTGKTTYVADIIKTLKNKNIYVIAFTHSAVENIKNIINLSTSNQNIKCKTLHSFFRINPNGGMLGVNKDFDYIFIDEYSLISKELLNNCISNLENYKRNTAKKLWYLYLVGDIMQLGCIKEFTNNVLISDLYKYENIIDSIYKYDVKIQVIRHINDIYTNKYANIVNLKKNYRNNSIIQTLINNIVFSKNYEFSKSFFIKSEDDICNLIKNNNYILISSTYKQLQNIMLKMSDDKSIIIKQNISYSLGYKTLCLKENMRIYTTINTDLFYNGEELIFKYYDENLEIIYCLNKNNEEIKIEKTQLYEYFPISPSYLLTIHKSQGKSIDNVILSIDNLFEFPMLYTGISRARNNIKLYSSHNTQSIEKLFNTSHTDCMNLLLEYIDS